jgi:hypothetical protein
MAISLKQNTKTTQLSPNTKVMKRIVELARRTHQIPLEVFGQRTKNNDMNVLPNILRLLSGLLASLCMLAQPLLECCNSCCAAEAASENSQPSCCSTNPSAPTCCQTAADSATTDCCGSCPCCAETPRQPANQQKTRDTVRSYDTGLTSQQCLPTAAEREPTVRFCSDDSQPEDDRSVHERLAELCVWRN